MSKTCSCNMFFNVVDTCNSFVSPRDMLVKRKACVSCVRKTRRTFDFRYSALRWTSNSSSADSPAQYLRSIRIPRASLETYYLFQWFHDSIGILGTINLQSITTHTHTHTHTRSFVISSRGKRFRAIGLAISEK